MNAFRLALLVVFCASGCGTTHQRLLDSGSSQVQLRSIQSRAFETADRELALRTIIATLQDFDFVIDEADDELGSVSATKLARYELRVTVTVRPHGERRLLIRANLQMTNKPALDPEPYQQFFAGLEKAMFLEAQQVD